VAFCETRNDVGFLVTTRLVLIGDAAREKLAQEPALWSAVMIDRRVTT
jgi:hypothetical protein